MWSERTKTNTRSHTDGQTEHVVPAKTPRSTEHHMEARMERSSLSPSHSRRSSTCKQIWEQLGPLLLYYRAAPAEQMFWAVNGPPTIREDSINSSIRWGWVSASLNQNIVNNKKAEGNCWLQQMFKNVISIKENWLSCLMFSTEHLEVNGEEKRHCPRHRGS